MLASDVARSVPPTCTASGTTLWACCRPLPATSCVTDSTAESKGDSSRDTRRCSELTTSAAVTTGSRSSSGIAACPPAPRTVISNRMAPAMKGPGRENTAPLGSAGQTWKPNAADTPSNTPMGRLKEEGRIS